jgi:hypothetical protein
VSPVAPPSVKGEGWHELIPPTYPPDAPAPRTSEEVEAALMGLLFMAQNVGGFPRCGGATFEALGLDGRGLVLHFDNRLEEDDSIRIEIKRERIAPSRETPLSGQPPETV